MTELPEVGSLVLDTARNRIGEVMRAAGERVLLRAPGTGREWEALSPALCPATLADELRSKVAEANARSRQGRGQPATQRCEACLKIKHRRHQALEAGDQVKAARMTAVMGVHLRAAH
ncbi:MULTISPECIES: hypothetical protein [Streptomyces]|uniref:Uncharacterized protein n=1 Tax=Streptomyces luteosporeus TaxID=173856 RepID=A0ABP6GNV3_9ACTN